MMDWIDCFCFSALVQMLTKTGQGNVAPVLHRVSDQFAENDCLIPTSSCSPTYTVLDNTGGHLSTLLRGTAAKLFGWSQFGVP